MFDLKKNNLSEFAEAGYEFELVLPDTAQETGAFVKVRGVESKKVQAYIRKNWQEQQLKETKAKRQGREVPQMTIDEMEDALTESAIVRIIGWRGIAEDGKEVPFTQENAERILNEHKWIRTAVIEQSSDGSRFRGD